MFDPDSHKYWQRLAEWDAFADLGELATDSLVAIQRYDLAIVVKAPTNKRTYIVYTDPKWVSEFEAREIQFMWALKYQTKEEACLDVANRLVARAALAPRTPESAEAMRRWTRRWSSEYGGEEGWQDLARITQHRTFEAICPYSASSLCRAGKKIDAERARLRSGSEYHLRPR